MVLRMHLNFYAYAILVFILKKRGCHSCVSAIIRECKKQCLSFVVLQ